jgi:hypothetical protein
MFSFSAFCEALAMADLSTFSMGLAARLLVKRRIAKASFTFRPLMASITSLAFCAELLTYFPIA